MKWSITVQTGIVTLITFVFLGFLGRTFYVNALDQVEAAQWLVHSHEVLRSVESAFTKVKDTEIALHDYQLTQSGQYHKYCDNALAELQQEVNHLAALTTDNVREQARIPWIDKLLFDWQADIQTEEKLREIHSPQVRNTAFVGSKSIVGGQIREILSEIREQEYALLDQRNDLFRKNNSRDIHNVSILIFITFVLLSISFLFVLYYERERQRSQKRSALQYEVTRILSQTESMEDAAEQIVAIICKGLNFNFGLLWWNDTPKEVYSGEEGNTRPLMKGWSASQKNSKKLDELMHLSGSLQPLHTMRLPVLTDGNLLWMDEQQYSKYLHSDKGIPVWFNKVIIVPIKADNIVLGGLELSGLEIQSIQPVLQQLLDGLAQQLAQFIEKRKTDRRLKEREEIFQQLVDNIKEVFWVSTPDAKTCLYVSPAYEQMWGLSRQEIYANPQAFIKSVIPEDRSRVTELLSGRELSTEGASGIEYRLIKSDGEERWIWSDIFPVRDQDGAIIRLCGIAHDITERKEMEKRVSEFYSMVSHELRTPLTSIRAALGLLDGGLAGTLQEKASQLIKIAKNESDRLIRLINDILDIRKIAAGKLELKREVVDPAQVVEITIKSLAAMAADLQVELVGETNINQRVFGDKDRIIQVLTNLVSNAIKFSPAGSKIKIILESAGQSVKFSVVDQGPGIPADQLDKLFRPFQQLDSSDTRAKGGTGLGLTISKAIVEEHGGKIGVDTAIGAGATFWFELPLIVQSALSIPGQNNFETLHKILIVEDDAQLAELLKLRLQQDGYDLHIATTLKAASHLLASEEIKAIILDMKLPDGNGLDWLKSVRELPEGKILPVVVITGCEREENTYSVPMLIAWLNKPFEEKELLNALALAVKEKNNKKAKVLIVEDDRSTRKLIIDQLQRLQHLELHFFEATDGDKAIDIAVNQKPDLIILDIGLPYKDGFTVVEALRKERVHNTPMLVYTSRDINKQEMEKLTLGLTRHLVKSRTSETQFLDTVSELLVDATSTAKI